MTRYACGFLPRICRYFTPRSADSSTSWETVANPLIGQIGVHDAVIIDSNSHLPNVLRSVIVLPGLQEPESRSISYLTSIQGTEQSTNWIDRNLSRVVHWRFLLCFGQHWEVTFTVSEDTSHRFQQIRCWGANNRHHCEDNENKAAIAAMHGSNSSYFLDLWYMKQVYCQLYNSMRLIRRAAKTPSVTRIHGPLLYTNIYVFVYICLPFVPISSL